MLQDSRETIYALATPHGVGGVAVIRVSGPASDTILAGLAPDMPLPDWRVLARRCLRARSGEILDDALVVRFAAGASYTGEAVVELHLHGSVATVGAVLDALSGFPGCRPAEPGEFTRRALLNGRMDLAAVEALGDLLQAETAMQRKQALAGLQGAVTARVRGWRDRLLAACALVEVTIDWVDEEVPIDTSSEVLEEVATLRSEIRREVAGARARDRLAHGFEIAVIGAPNSGKSSFINYLAGHDAVITSPVPGTTRDVIELRYDLDGLPAVFLDMAGLRETDDPVERIGVERAIARARSADLRIHLKAPDTDTSVVAADLVADGDFEVWSKSDLVAGGGGWAISTVTGTGVTELLDAIRGELATRVDPRTVIGNARQRTCLAACDSALQAAEEALVSGVTEIGAEHLRRAVGHLGDLVGETGVERILDRVFAGFCLGK